MVRRGLLVGVAAAAVVSAAQTSQAEPVVSAGAVAGATLGPREYFPTYLLGAVGGAELPVASRVEVGLIARAQYYYHREEEFGSRGLQEDLSATVRLHLHQDSSEPARWNPFIAARFGGAAVERFPFSATGSFELIGGFLGGGSIGLDFTSARDATVQRFEVSFLRRSFTTDHDAVKPVGEISVALCGVFAP